MLTQKLTKAHILRHAPSRAGAGFEAALIDVAQDFLLSSLAQQGVFKYIALKGGTAIRKFYAGNGGRFSTDLDFAITSKTLGLATAHNLIVEGVRAASNDFFRYNVTLRRGRPEIEYESDFGEISTLSTKVDIGPLAWIKPSYLKWICLPIHAAYNFELPAISVINLPENMSEKIARLNRRVLARDMYDLIWLASNSPHSAFDKTLVGKLSVLKVWVDNFGMSSQLSYWPKTIDPVPFNQSKWSSPFEIHEISDEQIGLLTSPKPELKKLSADFCKYYSFLSTLDKHGTRIANGSNSIRNEVISELKSLHNGTLECLNIW